MNHKRLGGVGFVSGDEVGKGGDAGEVLFVFFVFGRHGDAVLLFDGQTEFERVDRVQTETVDKQRGRRFRCLRA